MHMKQSQDIKTRDQDIGSMQFGHVHLNTPTLAGRQERKGFPEMVTQMAKFIYIICRLT